jgi:hypothetical protein
MLLSAGAKASHTNRQGKTAANLAVDADIAKLLE